MNDMIHIATAEIMRFLAAQLPALSPDWWQKHVVDRLSFQQQRIVQERGHTSLQQLDLAALLRILDQNWYELSGKLRLPREARTWLKELQTVRNKWAHMSTEALPASEAYRDADTLGRVLTILGSEPASLRAVEAAKAAALAAMTGQAASRATVAGRQQRSDAQTMMSDTAGSKPQEPPAPSMFLGLKADTPLTPFMRDLEERFKRASGLPDRAYYKIFYCQIKQAPILTLGINPGGAPENTNPDGRTHKDGAVAAASGSYYENDEHDVLDCEWPENRGLRAVLTPLVGGNLASIRNTVVKTNMAFHRSAKKKDINIGHAMDQATPFLAEIIEVVRPRLVLLTGVHLIEFTRRFASNVTPIVATERDPRVNQVVFAACRGLLRSTDTSTLVAQVAPASQFGWTYDKYQVAERIRAIAV